MDNKNNNNPDVLVTTTTSSGDSGNIISTKYVSTSTSYQGALNVNANINYHFVVQCSKCKKNIPDNEIIAKNWSGPKIIRSICKLCYCKVMDKLFELDIDIETEQLLYEEV